MCASSGSIKTPNRGDYVYKEECVLCFATCSASEGIWCCGQCFEGFCRDHFTLHVDKYPSHSNFLVTRKEQKSEDESVAAEGKTGKITKLEIPAEKAPQYEYHYSVHGDSSVQLSDFSALIDASDAGIKHATASGNDGWTEPSAEPCEHTLTLAQASDANRCDPENATCKCCELKSNLWKCLTCGVLSCGRRQFDGSGGNGHALEHFQSTGHSLAVKLGTIVAKADGLEADVYCYACDDMVVDLGLQSHLLQIGINVQEARKTEQSMSELQVHINLTHSYSMKDSRGDELKSVSGPWYRGFANLGNSCYLASVVQALRNLDGEGFLAASHSYSGCTAVKASDCFKCQLKKLYEGLGRDEGEDESSTKLRPWMFKRVSAGSHAEFASSRQQDASEFLLFLLQNRYKRESTELAELAAAFEFRSQDLISCEGCGKFRVTSNDSPDSLIILNSPEEEREGEPDLQTLLNDRFSPETIELRCGDCSSGTALKRLLINWVPQKVDCHVGGMEEDLSLKKFCEESKTQAVQADPVLLGELLMMGIEEPMARAALISCKNSSIDAAMTAIFDGSAVISDSSASSESSEPTDSYYEPEEAVLEMLTSAGFSRVHSVKALRATEGNLERAFDWIFSHPENGEEVAVEAANEDFDVEYELSAFITHKGTSPHCGHYVAHLKQHQPTRWILYNDEKVAEAVMDSSFPVKDAFIYIYKRRQ